MEGLSSYDGCLGLHNGITDSGDVDMTKHDGVQIIPNKIHPRTGFPYAPMFIHYGVSRKNWQSFIYFISRNLASCKNMKETFDAGAFADWLIEWNRHYFEPKGLYVDLAWRGEYYSNLDVVDSKDQHSHLEQAYVTQAAKHIRVLVVIINTPSPRAGTRPHGITFPQTPGLNL
ncbi:hypothetical protein AOQ84DRAFT_381275 [Glonium stellatum]|uniref:Uncharacterized protein n=1 Tax=Glonium stellatum TaxID=574774 RepID=A0A8E2ES00_9PEZI|nr:hypothetical protein AOQ84DRAFT_381275 [Glonium stellatum]